MAWMGNAEQALWKALVVCDESQGGVRSGCVTVQGQDPEWQWSHTWPGTLCLELSLLPGESSGRCWGCLGGGDGC